MFFLHPLLFFLLSTSAVAFQHKESAGPLLLPEIGRLYAGPWYRIPKPSDSPVSRIAYFNYIYAHLTAIYTRMMLLILVLMDL